MRRATAFLLAGAACLCAAGESTTARVLAADKVQLAWKFTEGEQIHFVVEQSSSVGTAAGTGATTQTLDLEWRVKSVSADQKATLEQTIQRLRMSLDMPPFGKIDYDSKAPKPKDPIGQTIAGVMSKLVGKKYVTEMTPEGAVESGKPAARAKKPAKPANGADPLGGIAPDAEMWQSVVAQASLPLPAEPIAPGYKWTKESVIELPQIGKQSVSTVYHYIGPETESGRTLHKIEMTSEIRAAGKGAGEKGAGAAAPVEINKHTGEGVLYFDATRGLLDHGQMTQKTSVKLGNAAVGGKTYDVEAETTIRRED